MSYVACRLFIVFLKRHTKPVYDNNCSREQTHTSCTVCLFALELSSVKTFSCTCKITSSVWISRSLLSRLPELRNERKSWKCNISPAIFFFLIFLSSRGGTRRGVAYRGRARADGGQLTGTQPWWGVRNLSLISTDGLSPTSYLHLELTNWSLCPTDRQEEDNRVFLSTLTRSQAAAVERRMASFQQTLRRRNRQHVPDVRDIFRPPQKVHRCTWTHRHTPLTLSYFSTKQVQLSILFCVVKLFFFFLWELQINGTYILYHSISSSSLTGVEQPGWLPSPFQFKDP